MSPLTPAQMRQMNDYGQAAKDLFEDARADLTEQQWTTFMDIIQRFTEKELDGAWKGVYPGYCIDPDICRGKTACPRNYSCVE